MIVTSTTYVIILSIIYIFSLSIIFQAKKNVTNDETNLYGGIIIVNFIGLILHLLCDYISYNYTALPYTFSNIIYKLYLFHFFVFGSLFLRYTLLIIYKDKFSLSNKNTNLIHVVLAIVFLIVIFFFPTELYQDYEKTIFYTYGTDVKITYVMIATVQTATVIMSLLNIKRIDKKKAIPIFIFVVTSAIMTMIQRAHPEIVLGECINSFTCLLMFFTIENPDVRMLEYEQKAKELAISASEAKSAFLSSMSHELRTPLNAIVGLSEDIASYKEQVPNEVKEDTNDIINASNTLLELIGNILDISKIEGGKLELIEADYFPKEEIESLLKIMRTKVEEKDLELNVFIDPNIPDCLFGDRLRIKQIINNFLSNAIKYTEKGHVSFGVRWINNALEIKVADSGRGIKPEDMGKLFEKFERLHVEKTSSVQGTGLGLSITKSLVELMGGSINVDSVYGQGSTFSVIIPQKLGDPTKVVREALSVEEKHTTDYTGKKLLVVDDNKLNIKVLRKAIASFNFEIDECYDGQTAINKINAGNYDIVLMDIMMPIMGGEEAMGILKQNPDFKIPVIALTADATTGAKERYLACGFVDYLAKPFSRDIIAKKLENILGNTK